MAWRNFLRGMSSGLVSISVTLADRPGALKRVLSLFDERSVNLSRIESRPSRRAGRGFYDILVESRVEVENEKAAVAGAVGKLEGLGYSITLLNRETDTVGGVGVPWFPRRLRDLDEFADHVLSFGSELESNHPGFLDEQYRERRRAIAERAKSFRTGDALPDVEYTPEEHATWRTVYEEVRNAREQFACEEVRHIFPLLERNCGFGPNRIPQLRQVSEFMKDCTGWTLRPVSGLLSSRDFLNGLAFRVFHSTQYIRHSSTPLYTPEPDICHELLGHVPMLCDPDFAAFSQEIGLASLAVSDEDIEKLAKCYWFSVEFGLCKEGNNTVKAYGAGLLSSFGEIRHAMQGDNTKIDWDPSVACNTPYPITEVCESLVVFFSIFVSYAW
uniref:phenylalanine 4-monooxygenase n=1 Tax=Compsopogon caeruleus TaxID=31354 RepID=A0A7S1TH46_9RHOD|mmetsp:Transcript_7279/g.14920  ORF Transcript_7279/g.14920 Transcript_7279/m.14920 type:complete len:386 (+) Transcript_7279:40-1197(+)